MAAITDGAFTSPLQDGDKQVVFPFDFLGDAYARMITRPYVMLSSSYSAPRTLTTTSVTNYALRSETFDNASWVKADTTVTADGVANPMNGGSTADSLLETATTAVHTIGQAYTFTAVAHAFSIYVKANGRGWCALEMADGTANRNCYFNLSTGAVGTAANGAVGSTISVGNDWYKLTIVATCAAGAGAFRVYVATADLTVSYLGDITKGLYLWGAQLELASSAGTYLPTTTATRTSSLRTRDAVDNSGDSAADHFAFLCQETPPDAGSLRQGIARLSRTYCRLPATQTDYGSSIINRPVMNDIKSGSSYAATIDNGVTSTVWGSRTAATIGTMEPALNSSAIIPSTPGSLGHILISVTLNNSAQTFYADDNDATIWAALSSAVSGNSATYASNAYFPILRNSGTMVIGNATVSCTLKALSSSDALTEVAVGSGRLLGTGAAGIDLLEIRAVVSNGDSVRRITTSLAAAAGSWMAVWNGDKLAAVGKVVATDGSTYSDLKLSDIPGKDFAVTHAALASAGTRYVNGPVSVSTKIVTDFYYPGWSPGVTTPSDIGLVAPQLDPISWLGLIVAGTSFGVIEGSQLEKYQGGPFYSQTTVSAQMSDALDTVAAGA